MLDGQKTSVGNRKINSAYRLWSASGIAVTNAR